MDRPGTAAAPATYDATDVEMESTPGLTEDDLLVFPALVLLVPVSLGIWALLIWGMITVLH
jgi:hypothetical protein